MAARRVSTVCFASLLVLGTSSPPESLAHPAPSPGTLVRLQQQHHPSDWLRVTLDSTRLEIKARTITERGLGGLTLRDPEPDLTDPLPWSRVERIHVVRDVRTRGALIGTLLGGVGAAMLAQSGDFVIGGAGGGLALGLLAGKRLAHEEELYRAASFPPRSEDGGATAPAASLVVEDVDTPEGRSSADSARALAAASGPTPPSEHAGLSPRSLDRLTRAVESTDLLRVHGSSGLRYGYASEFSPEGLVDFRPDARMDPNPEPIALISWSDVTRVDKRVSSARRGALIGGIPVASVFGAIGGVVGAFAASESGSVDPTGGFAIGALLGIGTGFAIGGALGAGVGATIPRWDEVLEVP